MYTNTHTHSHTHIQTHTHTPRKQVVILRIANGGLHLLLLTCVLCNKHVPVTHRHILCICLLIRICGDIRINKYHYHIILLNKLYFITFFINTIIIIIDFFVLQNINIYYSIYSIVKLILKEHYFQISYVI